MKDMITAGLSEQLESTITAAIRAVPINSSKSHSDLYYGMMLCIIRRSQCWRYQGAVTGRN